MNPTQLLGIPYKYNSSTMFGCDCYGLVRLYYDFIFHVQLPKLDYDESTEIQTVKRELKSWIWIKTRTKETGNVMIFNQNGNTHLGICLDEHSMLTTMRKTGSVIIKFKYWIGKLEHMVRYKYV